MEKTTKYASVAASADADVTGFGDVIYSYTAGCNVFLATDGTITLQWANGAAVTATRGATIDYIPREFFIHLTADGKSYAMFDDYAAMVAGKVDARLAWVICLLRQTIFSLGELSLNAAETVRVTNVAKNGKLGTPVSDMLKNHGPLVSSFIQQSFTILAMNGESLLARGHHWNDTDQMWKRFDAATQWSDHMGTIGIQNFEAPIFHHAFHPFDYDWVASLVADPESELKTHINGVALRRLGTLPAGCTSLGLFEPLWVEVKLRNTEFAQVFNGHFDAVQELLKRVRSRPLDFCIHLPRTNTATNLALVARIEPAIAVLYGYLKAINIGKTTVMQAKSLKNIAQRANAAAALGEQAAAAYAPEEKSKDILLAQIKSVTSFDIDSTAQSMDEAAEPRERRAAKQEESDSEEELREQAPPMDTRQGSPRDPPPRRTGTE